MPKLDVSEIYGEDKRRIIMLTITNNCNLKCNYCYEKHRNRTDQILNLSIAQKIISEYMNLDDGLKRVEIQFFGGEPMLAFPRIKEIVEWVIGQKWDKEYFFGICTNGTILSDEMKDWLVEHKDHVMVGFSIDGSRRAHNLTRSNSYDLLIKNIPFFKKYWPTQFAKMTICAETIPYVAESIIALENLDIPFTANVVFEDIWGDDANKIKLLKTYEEQLEKVVEFYLERDDLFPASFVDRKIEFIDEVEVIQADEKNKRFCGAGHEMLEVDINGAVSPCHRFAEWITDRKTAQVQLNIQERWEPKKCAECRLLQICPTCAGFNWEINGDSAIRTTFHCEAFKLEVLASAKLQAHRLTKKSVLKMDNRDAFFSKKKIKKILEIEACGL